MKKILFIAGMMLATLGAQAQLYQYTYDAAGNRTVRRYSVNGMSLLNEDESEEKKELSKMLQDHQVNISTSEEEINVRVSNVDNDTQGDITVYATDGTQVAKKYIREEDTSIDMSSQATGVYITQVTVNGNSTSWKVVKK